ncbi:MAG: hypothetical protein ACKO3T_04105, partial [Planctomycetaceae bacterium]
RGIRPALLTSLTAWTADLRCKARNTGTPDFQKAGIIVPPGRMVKEPARVQWFKRAEKWMRVVFLVLSRASFLMDVIVCADFIRVCDYSL